MHVPKSLSNRVLKILPRRVFRVELCACIAECSSRVERQYLSNTNVATSLLMLPCRCLLRIPQVGWRSAHPTILEQWV